ncbi:hypothetical protein C8R44DRAFT_721027 [Mycena epipterygia]|nr:hypothetical protein C8R44DRAFT_721027 [Mycena epipterygia]
MCFGAQSTGGRDDSDHVVSNLNDPGTGSLKDAIVVFSVGGLITNTDRNLVNKNICIARLVYPPLHIFQPRIPLDSPGTSITVYGNGVSYSNMSMPYRG